MGETVDENANRKTFLVMFKTVPAGKWSFQRGKSSELRLTTIS